MTDFYSGPAPKGFKTDFESFLFNTQAHRLTQSKLGWLEFHLLNRKAKKILASVSFHLQSKTARSPLRAPFGSFEFSSRLTIEDLVKFVSDVDSALTKGGIRKIEVINPPDSYTQHHKTLISALILTGYTPVQCDLSSGIIVDRIPLANKMNKGKRKQYKRGQKAGFKFKSFSLKKIDVLYNFIKSCRDERNQKLSLTLKELHTIVKPLPNSFYLFGVYSKKDLVAASICIKVKKSILYTFYSAHSRQHELYSPLTFLLANLYNWCLNKKIKLLDMGTSTLHGKPNYKLLDFKLRVGGVMSPKFTFHKRLP